jgi:hypothetical protein
MPLKAHFDYFRHHPKFPVSTHSAVWKSPLALQRKSDTRQNRTQTAETVSFGEYFQAVRKFLEKSHYRSITEAVSQQIRRNINPEEIKNIRVCLEKHGAFYHPARIDVSGHGFATQFVLNVAISPAGRGRIREEYSALEKLYALLPQTVVPRVYCRGEIRIRDELKMSLFLGQWFEGYHEFHLARDPRHDTIRIRVWDPDQGGIFLSREQARELYRQTSRILTLCYNLATTEQIFYWHHAAGDFIVKLAAETMDVKLIAVRRYSYLIKNLTGDVESILQALLIFFLNLTLRMRLDRIDGVGQMVWSDASAVEGTVLGFLEGLVRKHGLNMLPETIAVDFITYLSNVTDSDLLDITGSIVDTYPPQTPEVALIRRHLPAHVVALRQVIQEFCSAVHF